MSINQANALDNSSEIYFVLLTNKYNYVDYKPYLENKKSFMKFLEKFVLSFDLSFTYLNSLKLITSIRVFLLNPNSGRA